MNPTESECVPGDTVVLSGLPTEVCVAVTTAILGGTEDVGGGAVTVQLECSVAQQLMFALATSMRTNFFHREDL